MRPAGKTCLVPLTDSLYINAEVSDTDNVLLDIGTGYFVEQKREDAQAYLDRKVSMIKDNASKLEEVLQDKRKKLDTLHNVIRQKVQAGEQFTEKTENM